MFTNNRLLVFIEGDASTDSYINGRNVFFYVTLPIIRHSNEICVGSRSFSGVEICFEVKDEFNSNEYPVETRYVFIIIYTRL